jgi:hypothetical protein
MKNEQLKKINWTDLGLPVWRGKKLHAKDNGNGALIYQNTVSCAILHVAYLNKDGWLFHTNGSWRELEELKSATETVDAFIASELARIEREEKAARLPKTKVPEGWFWSRPSGGETVWLDDGTRSWSLPDEHARVVFGLLCKAYDELHGVETVNAEAQIVEFNSINHPTQKGGHWSVKLHIDLSSDTDSNALMRSLVRGTRRINVTLEGIK